MIDKNTQIKCGKCNTVENYTITTTKRGYNKYTCNVCGQPIPTYLIPDYGLTPIQLEKRLSNSKSNPTRDFDKYKKNKIKAKTEAALQKMKEVEAKLIEIGKNIKTAKKIKTDIKGCAFKDDELSCIHNCRKCKWDVTKNTYSVLSANCPFNNTEDCIKNCSNCHWQLKQSMPDVYKPLEVFS